MKNKAVQNTKHSLLFPFFFSLTHELREDFDKALQGSNLKEADLKTLTGGARIANIFRERFPFELIKVLTIITCFA